jgi:predicted ATP-grasp superfamily ATP-dependent carboligase
MNTLGPLKDSFGTRIKRLSANLNKTWFLAREILRSFFFRRPKLNILFSVKPAWEPNIRIGFRSTRHHLLFDAFTDENIEKSDLAVPLTMKDLKYLSTHSTLAARNAIAIPTLNAIEVCDDKYLFYKTLKQNGFDDYLPKVGTHLPYPYILKKRVAEDGDNCYIIFNTEDEKTHADQVSDAEYFSQEIVAGHNEYATHILFKDGKVKSAINIKYDFNEALPIKGQNTYISRKICGCPYLNLFTEMLNSIGFEGLCCFNYKVRDKRPYVFEINPRFGGSLSPFFFSFVSRLD